ncbi:uncharacterized protein LOC129763317 [Toxorhynchites rutilus septentrionalis]|uniref:uncharacterized protein LOC129763317 n=1 Tax=Toxorhynchites rutilus septentrionalis TaxID=329112 RepID=UPI00247AF953|nr:uncharacterized protein LOC129763317 [Toxorhynchites rutilus septentrionalis]
MQESDDDDEEMKPSASQSVIIPVDNGSLIYANDSVSPTAAPDNATSHIMRPPTRVENAFQLLSERLGKLFLYSSVPNSTESGVLENLKSPLTIFSVFNVIKFENAPCAARRDQHTSLQGICYHETECSQLGGVPVDLCAIGFGVCCVFQFGCNDRTTQNISYFQSPNYPAPIEERLSCTFTIGLRWNTQQVLVEFVFFEMAPPVEGNCYEDQLIISVQNSRRKYPIICGINSGQHLYLQIERESSPFVYLTATSNSVHPKAFSIKITQLAFPQAPQGCLQFFVTITGFIKSFNYDNHSTVVTRRNPSYLNNLNYAICIMRVSNFCSVTFTNSDEQGEENLFQLVNTDEEGVNLVRDNTAGVEIYNCPDDYIAINYLRLCGNRLNDGSVNEDYTQNSSVNDDSGGPIIVPVRSDEQTVGRGFKLMFRQEICTKSVKINLVRMRGKSDGYRWVKPETGKLSITDF